MDIYMVRHGYSTNNAGMEKCLDPELTQQGVMQAHCAGERLSAVDFDDIFASPMIRTANTAIEIQKCQRNRKPVKIMNTLLEIGTTVGYCGIGVEELNKKFGAGYFDFVETGFYNETEEIREKRYARAKSVLTYLRENYSENSKICIVAHGVYNQYLMRAILETPADSDINFTQCNCSISKARLVEGKSPRLVYVNDNRHIPAELFSESGFEEIMH